MILIQELLIGGLVISITVIVHAVFLDLIMRKFVDRKNSLFHSHRTILKPFISGIIVVSIFCAHIFYMWIWAMLYLFLRCEPVRELADALYFSTVTFTTLGYGDIILEPSCRMLSGIESANGLLIFGWTTAFIFEVISVLHRKNSL